LRENYETNTRGEKMLNTVFEQFLERERAIANLKPGDRAAARLNGKFDHFGEHPYTIPAHYGKLLKQTESKHLTAMQIQNQRIDELTLKLMSERNKNEQILDENFYISRKVKSLTKTNSKLIQNLDLEKSINKDSQRRIDTLTDRLRAHVG